MRQGVGEVFTYNMIIIFIVIVFGLLAATTSYYKAFKINSNVLSSIEKYEGYNSKSKEDITRIMNTIGYSRNNGYKCPSTRGHNGVLMTPDQDHYYCVYYHNDDRGTVDEGRTNDNGEPIYYNYSVVSYIYVDLPIIGNFKIPVYTKGERTYNFSDKNGVGA